MNITEMTAEKIKEIKTKRAAEAAGINAEIEKAQRDITKAEENIKRAIESTNIKDFEKYTQDKKKAGAVVEMYTRRLEQLNTHAAITEEESDAVITNLLEYEEELSNKYLTDCAPEVEKLRELTREYLSMISDAESTLNQWTTEIHPNHRTFGRSSFYKNGSYTDRSDTPTPVHRTPFYGCYESTIIKNFLEMIEEKEREL